MQKDIHFYLTYCLGKIVGIDQEDAEKIAWADQYTDELTEPELHGIQTQCDLLDNWSQRQIQFSVLVPFHFIPGSDSDHPWMTTRNNWRARKLVNAAARNGLFQLGIALHGFQDTFSHENFSGWQEDLNSCFPWYYIQSAIPNVGHAEMRTIPDVVNYVWTDPRNGKQINNKSRTLASAKATFDFLVRFFKESSNNVNWPEIRRELQAIFRLESYDERKQKIRDLSGDSNVRFKEINKKLEGPHKTDFIEAANAYLAEAMRLFKGLPRISG